MPHAVSSEWCAYQWSPQVSGWESQHDYSWNRVIRPLWCSPPINYPTSAKWYYQLLVYSPNIVEYENEDIPKNHLTAEEPTWDPSTSESSESETNLVNHGGQISIPATAWRGPVYVNAVISYSLAYDATIIIDNDYLVTSLSVHSKISIELIGTVRKPSMELIVLAKSKGYIDHSTED